MKRKININKVKLNKLILFFILLFFIVVIGRVTILAISNEIDGINMKEFVSNRNTRKKTIYAKRGTVYDSTGEILAQTVNSYTVIAYLSESRSEGFKTPQHVVDKEDTAKKLSKIINMSEEAILYLLNKNAYQVELGPGGRNITELKKQEIADLKLSGISFISSYKRYYPYGNFASYVIGYVKSNDEGKLNGEMGIESYYNKLLNGKDGYTIYQQDVNGYKIPNTNETKVKSDDGVDVHLTIDNNIQYFAEKYTKEAFETYSPEWVVTVVADAKTGAILASTSYPSFDPNIKNLTNYLNPLVSFSYEPGSTMKTFTYMATMEKGVYNGNDTFKSGSIDFGENTINDWLQKGFGTITYDEGFVYSSNVGISYLTKKYFTAAELKLYFEKFGFGKKTGIELPGELAGTLSFKYPIEVANAGFGQGILVTPIQMIQALTSISNDGMMLKPYIVDKVVDTNTDEIIYQGSKTELGQVASKSTVNKIKDLLYKVIYNDLYYSTGAGYKMEGYDLIGKTGTAQYINTSNGTYYFDEINYIRSFAGMFPKENPQIIIYTALKRPYSGSKGMQTIVKGLVRDISNYKNIYIEKSTEDNTYVIDNYINKNVSTITSDLENKFSQVVVIGDGNKIIDQYPSVDTKLSSTEKVYLLTNSDNIYMPDMTYWSLKEVDIFSRLSNIDYKYSGSGFVYYQNIELNKKLTSKDKIEVKLSNKIES